MKMRKIISLLMALLLISATISGCDSKKSSGENKKEKVTIALWGNQMLENYVKYICDSFPEVDFEFVLATNSTDYYRYRQEHDDMPDILSVRRFALKDAVYLKDYLYDLSNTELASTYYGTYLDNYTYDDGTVNWLPACAEVDGLIINKTLFEEYNVPIPTDYESFIAACQAFEAIGIRGFVSDFGSDYTCMEVLQGASIPNLLSMEGREWRQRYESGSTNQLSEYVWMPVFERFFDLKEKIALDKDDADMDNREPKDLFSEGKAAMFRGTGADVITFPGRGNDEVLMMPYFGDTQKDNWLLTYPSFQIAASKNGMDDPKREALILSIMETMLSQKGQNYISYGKNMIPYNKSVTLELLPELDNMKPYINENKMYIRIASNEMFSISKDVVQNILTGKLKTPKDAFNAFNAYMSENKPKDQAVAHIDTEYPYEFTPKHGNMAASAVFNTYRTEMGADLLFAHACYVGGSVYEGDYTQKELGYLTKNDGGWPMLTELTGDQVYKMVEETLALTANRGAICNDSTLYVSSGFEMDITKTDDGYKLNALTKDGKNLDRNVTYSVIIYGDRDWYIPAIEDAVGIEKLDIDVPKAIDILTKRLVEDGGQLDEPTDYIVLR